jgi:acetyl-CoA carboxylase biotin carboxyl carrier protein
MELESIYALMERFERSSISGLELEQNGTRLKLEKAVAVAAAPAVVATPVAAPAPAAAPAAGQPAQAEEGEYIKAPLVGTFYTAAGPDAAPFVQVGDKVQKGQTVCILEAMKAMSEIPAPMDCVIEEVLLDNGSLAAFDAPLFRVRRV